MNEKNRIGKTGEDIAAEYLEKLGYRIICKNYRSGHLETDIICEDETHILFVEVKNRRDTTHRSGFSSARAAVDEKKKMRLWNCAKEYIYKNKPQKKPRIDVIEVYLGLHGELDAKKDIKHIKNAITG